MKNELWNAIQKWHEIEKDLEEQFMKSDNSKEQMDNLRSRLKMINIGSVEMEAKMKEEEA